MKRVLPRGFGGTCREETLLWRGTRDLGMMMDAKCTVHLSFHETGESEVGDFGDSVVEEDVGRLDVAVDDLLLIKGFEALDDVLEEYD